MKTKQSPFLWLVPIVLAITGIALIPLNLFLLGFPQWIMIIIIALILFSAVIMWIKLKKKIPAKILISLLSLLGMVISFAGSYCNPYWNSLVFKTNADWYCENYDKELTFEKAKSDLDYAMSLLKRVHPLFYGGVPDKIQQAYDSAVQNLRSADKITVNTTAQEIQSLLFLLEDAHTHITLNFPDERYMKYTYSHKQSGDVLMGINGMTWEQLLDENSFAHDKVSYEVKDFGRECLSQYVSSIEGLDYLGISVKEGVTYNYETKEGEKNDQFAEEADFLPYEEYAEFNNIEDNTTEEQNFVSYEINKEKNAAVLTLDQCNYNDEYISTVRKMFEEIKEQGIANLAVDLRNNGGGNSLVANEFLRYIDVDSYKDWACDWRLGPIMISIPQSVVKNDKYEDLLYGGSLYLLTSTYTFSSAMFFAQYVKDNDLGTIIGEPSGNAPDSCGDVTFFKLPNSGAIIQISTKKWYRIDNLEGLIEPDIPCESYKALDKFYEHCK